MTTTFSELDKPVIDINSLDKVTFDGTVYNEVTKSADNSLATTQANTTYDNFLLHSSKEWLSTLEGIESDIIKETKDTSDKIKSNNKVLEGVNKAAPDANPYKDTKTKLEEGVKDLANSAKSMTEVYKYSGAINFISSTSVNTVAGSITNTSDLGTINRSPSITNIANTNVNKVSTSINFTDTSFTKTDRDITVTNQQLTSASDKHAVVTNTTSITSSSNKTTAVNDHQVVTKQQSLYNNTTTILSNESALIGSKGGATLIGQTGLTIAAGQTNKTTPSGASVDGLLESTGNSLLSANITIQSTGDVKTQANGTVATSSDTVGMNANKIGLISIDLSSNSTNTTLSSKVQSSLISDGVTYTGNKNTGILVSPTAILAGTGLAPIIPLIGEVLPPIVIDIPELPEFPFGSLADFLSKCLPGVSSTIINDVQQDEQPDISLEDPLVVQNKTNSDEEPLITLEDPLIIQDKRDIDEPIDISLEDPLVTNDKKEPTNSKATKAEQTERDVTTTPTASNNSKPGQKPYTQSQAVTAAAKIGILNTVYKQTPEDSINNSKTTTQSTSSILEISPQLTFGESLKSLSNLQEFEVVNSFNKDVRPLITNNYNEFLKAVAVTESFGPQPLPDYSKTVNEFLSNKSLASQILTFINTKRPIGQGGQQPPNIQNNVVNPVDIGANLRTSIDNSFSTAIKRTPPTPGQGIIDVLTTLDPSKQSPSLFSSTTSNWYNPEDITEFSTSNISFGDQLLENNNIGGLSDLLNNKYVESIKGLIPDSKIQSALSLTQDIASGKITTAEQYATALSNLVGGDISTYISYAQQALNIYKNVQEGNYTSLLGIPGVSNVLGSKGTAIASNVLSLISKKNITDKDIYAVAGNIFTALTGIGIPLLDELAKLLGCIDSLKEANPFLQSISNPDLQDIIDYLPRIIQTTKDNNINRQLLNITPSNCGQVSELSAEEATINLSEIGPSYIKFKLSNKDLIRFNNNPLPEVGTYVNLYSDFYTDRINNKVLVPYKIGSQFTSNIIEYIITDKQGNEYTAKLINTSTKLTLEDNISGTLYEYITSDIGNRLIPYILDSYILL